jgi:ribosome biogenesis GTPase
VMNKKAAFCGHSGVGKTSLLASLLENREIGKIGEVNSATGKGRHTTTGSIMLAGPEQSSWIDTPGVRQFGLAVPADKLREYFPEFLGLDCSNKGCMHYNEEGCNARALSRYQSYRRIFESLSSGGY